MIRKFLPLIILLLSGCADVPVVPDGTALPVFGNESTAVTQVDGFFAGQEARIRKDALNSIEVCHSPQALTDPTSQFNCPQCGQAVIIMLDNNAARKDRMKAAAAALRSSLLGIGDEGLLTLRAKLLYTQMAGGDPKAMLEADYKGFLADAAMVRHACWDSKLESDIVRMGIKGFVSSIPIPKP